MEKGGKGFDCNLNRTNEYGVQEEYCYVYLPIYNRELIPVQPDEYSRGAEYSEELLYSIIMFEKKDELFHEFVMRSDDIYSSLVNDTLVVYILTTSLITFICIVITATVSLNVCLWPINIMSSSLRSLTTTFFHCLSFLRSIRSRFMSQNQ